LGEWRPTNEFVLAPYACSKELSDLSTSDFSRSGERDRSAFCRQGFGALLAKLAAPLPILLATPVKSIEWWSRTRIKLETTKGQFRTSAVILTVSTNVL